MTATITLETDELILRPIKREDTPQLYMLMQDKKIQEMLIQQGKAHNEWIADYVERLFDKNTQNHFTWGMV